MGPFVYIELSLAIIELVAELAGATPDTMLLLGLSHSLGLFGLDCWLIPLTLEVHQSDWLLVAPTNVPFHVAFDGKAPVAHFARVGQRARVLSHVFDQVGGGVADQVALLTRVLPPFWCKSCCC